MSSQLNFPPPYILSLYLHMYLSTLLPHHHTDPQYSTSSGYSPPNVKQQFTFQDSRYLVCSLHLVLQLPYLGLCIVWFPTQ